MGESFLHRHRPAWADWGSNHLRLGPVIVSRQSCAGSAQPRLDGAMVVMTDHAVADPRSRQTFGGVALRLGDQLVSLGVRGRPMFPSWRARRRWRALRHPIASRRRGERVVVGVDVAGEALVDAGPRPLP